MGKQPPKVKGINVAVKVVPVGSLVENPWNPNRMNPDTLAAAEASIKLYGFVDPVTVRAHPRRKGKWEIVDGEHRWLAAKNAGLRTVAVNVLAGLSDAQAKKLTVIMNETRGEADRIDLGKVLAELKAAGDDLAGLDLSPAEVDELIAIAGVEWAPDEREGVASDDDTEYHAVTMKVAAKDWPTVEHRLAGLVETVVKGTATSEVALGRALVYLLRVHAKRGD